MMNFYGMKKSKNDIEFTMYKKTDREINSDCDATGEEQNHGKFV